MMVMEGPKHVASHTIKHDVFDENCFIILVLNFNTSELGSGLLEVESARS